MLELEMDGITEEQRRAYIPLINNILRRSVTPVMYSKIDLARDLLPNLLTGAHSRVREFGHGPQTNVDSLNRGNYREDAWRFYLGMKQQSKTFGISDYVPSSQDQSSYCYKLNDFWKNYSEDWEIDGVSGMTFIEWILKNIQENDGRYVTTDVACAVMGNFSFESGEDENGKYIAYHDRWDLDVPIEREKGFFGKPFTIYDRLYYNEETFTPL